MCQFSTSYGPKEKRRIKPQTQNLIHRHWCTPRWIADYHHFRSTVGQLLYYHSELSYVNKAKNLQIYCLKLKHSAKIMNQQRSQHTCKNSTRIRLLPIMKNAELIQQPNLQNHRNKYIIQDQTKTLQSDAYFGNPGFGDGSYAIQTTERWGRCCCRWHRFEINLNRKMSRIDPGIAETKKKVV